MRKIPHMFFTDDLNVSARIQEDLEQVLYTVYEVLEAVNSWLRKSEVVHIYECRKGYNRLGLTRGPGDK